MKRPLISRATGWRLVLLCVVAGAAWLFNTPLPGTAPEDTSGPTVEAQGVRHVVVRAGGQTLCDVSARRVTVSGDKSELIAEDVTGGTLFQDGKPALHISARRVRLNQISGDIVASGEVRAQGEGGLSVSTPLARWNHSDARLSWPESAKATWRGVQFEAAGAFYDAKRKTLNCPQPLRAWKPDRAELRAPSAMADLTARRVELHGGSELVFRPGAGVPGLPALPFASGATLGASRTPARAGASSARPLR